jgi:alkylhydroperoxidase/carboxymuconolactone decarboxylase family protein YurZ
MAMTSLQALELQGKCPGGDMSKELAGISPAFQAFLGEAPAHARAWMQAVEQLGAASALDKKTAALAYLAVLAALRLESGVPFQVRVAKEAGATRAEVVSALLTGLPAVGTAATACLPAALAAYDAA